MFKMTNNVDNPLTDKRDPLVKNICPMIPLAKGTLGHNGTVWPIEPMVKGTHWSKILRPRGLVKASGKMIHTLYSYV